MLPKYVHRPGELGPPSSGRAWGLRAGSAPKTLSGGNGSNHRMFEGNVLNFWSLVQRFLEPPIPFLLVKLRLAISPLSLIELGLELGRLLVTRHVIDLRFNGSLAQRKSDETQHQQDGAGDNQPMRVFHR